MKKKKLFSVLVILLVLAGGIYYFAGDRLGTYLEPKLERLLTDLFGMPVTMEGLRVDVLRGWAKTSRITFHSLPQFGADPHLDSFGLEVSINLMALADHRVRIRKVLFRNPTYQINRIATPEGSRTDVGTWYDHIENWGGEDEKTETQEPKKHGKPWSLHIKDIELRNGQFIFWDRSVAGTEKKFVFQALQASLKGLRWPVPDPTELDEKVFFEGTMGEQFPAPFWIKGRSSFATSQVSFDLRGELHDGAVLDYGFLWEGMPVEITGGNFDLKAHVICMRRKLTSHNILVLKSLKVKPGSSAISIIQGMPVQAWIGFIQSHKKIRLKIAVKGDITDPQFGFQKAFRQAFQEALRNKAQAGFGLVTGSATKLATSAGGLVLETPARVVTGLGTSLGKITGAVRKETDKTGIPGKSTKEDSLE